MNDNDLQFEYRLVCYGSAVYATLLALGYLIGRYVS